MSRTISHLWALHTSTHELVNANVSGSGTRRWVCKYCAKTFSTTTTRLIRHVSALGGSGILACPKVPNDIAEAVRHERESAAASLDMIEDLEGGLNVGPSATASSFRSRTSTQREESESSTPFESSEPPSQRPRQGSLHSAYLSTALQKQRQKVAEIEIERYILECNLPFNVVRTDAWKRMVRAISQVGPTNDDWHGIPYSRLRTSLLLEEEERIDLQLGPIKSGWQTYGCSILSDGWSDFRRRHIINVMVSSCLSTYFLKVVDCSASGTRITGEYIYEHIKFAIEEVGVSNVVQIVTDNASNCKRMGEMIEAEFPSIVLTPCSAHCLDLLFEDIAKLSWLAPVLSDAKRIISFIKKNHQALSIFRSSSDKELVRTSETRFGYIYHVFSRLHMCLDSLRMTIIDRRWIKINNILPILRQIHVVLRYVDMEGSTLGLVYHMYTRMTEAIRASTTLSPSRREEKLQLVESRWEFMSRPIHGFAALLHPYFKSTTLWSRGSLRHMKDLYMERVMAENEQIAFDSEFSTYMENIGIAYACPTSMRTDVTSQPLEWWNHYGYGHPMIAPYALRVLSQVFSIPCERNWSAFSLVHTKLHNCLSVAQLQRVVYCKANLRLLRSLRDLKDPRQACRSKGLIKINVSLEHNPLQQA
ncbi:hypothetical protein KP509_09G014900 [Ceratopteris richardii]|uniref:BED-type domain-containing protein n=1 Tax=Ceratopteris richardii TaxID=49495 RepID=A0A8T2U0G2_CERRI|nr:hypothetical protein KP509_09G014900 [Ceratopteris richardii]